MLRSRIIACCNKPNGISSNEPPCDFYVREKTQSIQPPPLVDLDMPTGVGINNVRRKEMKSVAIASIFSLAIGTFFGCAIFPEWSDLKELAREGERTHGTVIAKEPSNHQSIRYEYTVGSQKYTGSGRAGSGGLAGFNEVKIGDQVEITYRPRQPSKSVIGLGSDALLGFSILLFGILPIFSIGAGTFAAWRFRKSYLKS